MPSEQAQYLLQLEKLENSHTLHGSESLRKLLRYLARHAIEHPGIPLKEYQIATEEVGRPSNFDPAVMNVHPQTSESKYYLAGAATAPLTEDYAVVGLVPGLNPARSVMIIAGTTTFGTQGAVEFVSNQDTVKQLLPRL